jgi:hypothetical protein
MRRSLSLLHRDASSQSTEGGFDLSTERRNVMPKSNSRGETSLDPDSKGKTGHAHRSRFAASCARNPRPLSPTGRMEKSVQNQPFGGDKRHPQSVEVKRFTTKM